MANSNGIFKRGSSHYLRVVLPLSHALRHQYKSGKVIVSLGACSYREALTAAAIKRAQILETTTPITSIKKILAPSSGAPFSYYLRDIYDRWIKSKPLSNDAINTCMRALLLYEEQTNNPPLHLLTRAQGDGFRAWLQEPERKTSSKTAYDRFTWVKTLLKYAYRDLEVISRHPWEGIELFKETTNQRRPWSGAELQTLFGQPLFQKYELPRDWRCGKDAAYWIPLLGLYTGARLSELAQLRAVDILSEGEIPSISITNLGSNQQLKTLASKRTIPIHSELIRLGFLGYANKIKVDNQDSLWPQLSQRKSKPGGYFSNWFGEYRARIGLKGYPDFHCFRHTVRSRLGEAEIPEHVIDSILGHEIKGSTGTKIYTHRTLKTLKNAIEMLNYQNIAQR
ncbi:integrase [Polynucleobacter sphagniphilus]|uniref:site-specific integrase n=1 Tax=Polynucleobacter sphagniphilus TaxID=1743169 RepID=UPI002473D84F|nr:site-specific integrase [Polynucleobacter sphagniphilus]MDH6249775.1 integrase [Polynucleobacter sphagniphilus]